MKIKDAIRKINHGTLDPVYFLKGDDQFLQSFFIENLSKKYFINNELNKTWLTTDELSGNEIIDKISTVDLFQTKQLFILKNPNKLKGNAAKDLISYCESPLQTNIVILIIDEYSDRSNMSKKLQNILDPIFVSSPFENDMKKWAIYFFKIEKKIVQNDVVDFLVEIAGDSVFHLKNEIEKISIWLNNKNQITIQDLTQFSDLKRKRQRWEFLSAIGECDLEKSILIGKIMITMNDNFISLLYPLTCLFQEILFYKLNNGTFNNFNRYVPIPPSIRKQIPKFSRLYTKNQTAYALKYLGNIDKKQKTSFCSDETELLQFISGVINKN